MKKNIINIIGLLIGLAAVIGIIIILLLNATVIPEDNLLIKYSEVIIGFLAVIVLFSLIFREMKEIIMTRLKRRKVKRRRKRRKK